MPKQGSSSGADNENNSTSMTRLNDPSVMSMSPFLEYWDFVVRNYFLEIMAMSPFLEK
jgi:hypothetical protein